MEKVLALLGWRDVKALQGEEALMSVNSGEVAEWTECAAALRRLVYTYAVSPNVGRLSFVATVWEAVLGRSEGPGPARSLLGSRRTS